MTNVNSSSFSDQREAFKTAISQAIQSILQESYNVTAEDVHRISIHEQKLKWLAAPENDVVDDAEGDDGGFGRRRLQSTWATVLTYDVTTWAYQGEYEDLAAALETASTNGDLQNAIQFQATNTADAEALVNIELTDQIKIYNRMHPNNESTRLTGARITMLILGVFTFLTLLGVIIAFAKQNKIPLSPPASPFGSTRPYREP